MRKGEHGLAVLAPVRVKLPADDGPRGLGGSRIQGRACLRSVPETDARRSEHPSQSGPVLLTGDGPLGAWDALSQLVDARGFTIERGPLFPANEYDLDGRRVSSRLPIASTPRPQSRLSLTSWHM